MLAFGASLQMPAQTQRESFEQFRSRIKGDYSQFRKTLLDNYADFLAGEWHEYKSLNGTKRDATPKPRMLPEVKQDKRPVAPAPKRVETPKPTETPKPAVTPKPTEAPKPAETPVKAEAPVSDRIADRFLLGTLTVQIPHYDYNIERKLYSNQDYAMQWRELDRQDVAGNVADAIASLAKEGGLNGYFTYKLAESYVNTRFAGYDATSRISLLHFLMAHLGYDVRLASTQTGLPLLLMPLDRKVHGRNFLVMDDKKYYIFAADEKDEAGIAGQPITTCRIPEDLNGNSPVDMLIGPMNLPFKGKPFSISDGTLTLTGEVNENLMPLLYRYPQMEVAEYSKCNPDPELRKNVAKQIKEQLAALTPDQGAEKLLGFMHNAFKYQTDEENHGFEKPYFIEETLYYPKNDCEDRAIFYSYYLWNSLGKESQLITFPGHAAATVRLDEPVKGVSYDWKGEKFWISDPTYRGSRTGMVMPDFANTKPNVELTYPK